MTNYTREQRKMIAEYLEKEILPMKSMLNQSLPFSVQDEWVNADDIVDKIKNLKLARFTEITQRIGTKFRADSMDKFGTFIICGTKNNEFQFVVNVRTEIIELIENIADDTAVEVINERTSK